MKFLTLAWVEIGRSLPRYLTRNIKLTSKLFPDLEQLVITEGKIWKVKEGKRLALQGQYLPSERTKSFYGLERQFDNRDRGFWQETTGRFFHLADSMKYLGIEQFFHMESDVVLLDSRAITQVLASAKRDFLAFPMQGPRLGCASVLVVNGEVALTSFLDLVLSRWESEAATDMTILGEFACDENSKKFFLHLPTILESFSVQSEYIWDAGAIGPYFLGGDARNRRSPIIRRGVASSIEWKNRFNEVSWFITSRDKKNDSVSMFACKGVFGTKYLANIHIHSKHIPSTPKKLKRMISRGIEPKLSNFWGYAGIDWIVVLERSFDFIRRRILRLKRRVINFR